MEVALALKASRRLDVRVGDFLAARPFTGDKSEKKREPDFATFRHKEGKSLDTEILMVGEAKNTALHRDEPRFIDISFLTMMRDRTTPDPDNQTYVPLCEKERWFCKNTRSLPKTHAHKYFISASCLLYDRFELGVRLRHNVLTYRLPSHSTASVSEEGKVLHSILFPCIQSRWIRWQYCDGSRSNVCARRSCIEE